MYVVQLRENTVFRWKNILPVPLTKCKTGLSNGFYIVFQIICVRMYIERTTEQFSQCRYHYRFSLEEVQYRENFLRLHLHKNQTLTIKK